MNRGAGLIAFILTSSCAALHGPANNANNGDASIRPGIAHILEQPAINVSQAFLGKMKEAVKEAAVPAAFIQEHLSDFQANSLMSDLHPELQIIGAGQFVDQVLELMTYDKYASSPVVLDGHDEIVKGLNSTAASVARLGEMFQARGSDKTHHGYHAFYAPILDDIVAASAGPIATLEIGLGTNDTSVVSSMGPSGQPGASERAFRDYLPSDAQIYGADIDRNILFREDRIKTAWVDQLDRNSFGLMVKDLGETTFNLIVDDGLHSVPANFNVLLFGIKHIRPGGWVVIEDIKKDHMPLWTSFVDGILRKDKGFLTMYAKLEGNVDAFLLKRLA